MSQAPCELPGSQQGAREPARCPIAMSQATHESAMRQKANQETGSWCEAQRASNSPESQQGVRIAAMNWLATMSQAPCEPAMSQGANKEPGSRQGA